MKAWVLPVCVGVVLSGSSIAAADPTKQECVAANESAQDLQRSGKLREARASLAVCTAASCPGPVREDCGQRLKEVEGALPRLVFAAKDAAGHDLSAVRVTMDGETLLDKLDGAGTPVNPGEHHFAFEADGFRTNESTLLVREGEMDRPVRVVLVSATAPAGDQASTGGDVFDGGTRRALGITLGATGIAALAVGGVFGVLAEVTYTHSVSECGGSYVGCPTLIAPQAQQDRQSAVSQALVSDIGFIAGGVLLVTGATLYFTAPKATTPDVAIAPTVSINGGGLVLRGKW
jgi:hypothetical protein